MKLRSFVVFTLMILLIVAAPVWATTGNIPELPRISGAVIIDGSGNVLRLIEIKLKKMLVETERPSLRL